MRLGCLFFSLLLFIYIPVFDPVLVGSVSRQISLFTQSVRSTLPSLPFAPPLSFSALGSLLRQQNVSALRLYVRPAVNKLNAVLTGHREVASANPCILVALTFTIPSYFCHLSVVIGLSSSNHKGDGYKSRGLHRWNYPFRRRVIRNNGIMYLQCMTNRADLLTLFCHSGVIFKDHLRLTVGQVWGEGIKMWHWIFVRKDFFLLLSI